MFTRFAQPTSTRTIWTAPHQNLAPSELTKASNQNKLMYNDENGEIQFMDYTFLDDVEVYPTFGDFPATGDPSKMYLDQALNRVYRWAGAQYFYVPHDVYSKTESDTNYYQKTDLYTKTEADNKYVIRAQSNDLASTQLNNIQSLHVLNSATLNATNITLEKPILAGWQDWQFVNSINNKLLLDGTTTRINSNLDMQTNEIINSGTIHASNMRNDSLQRSNGVPMITFDDDIGMNVQNKDIRQCRIIQLDTIHRHNSHLMMRFPDDDTIDCAANNLIDVTNANITNVVTPNVQYFNGVSNQTMINFPNDSTIHANGKSITNANEINTNTYKRNAVGNTTMISFPDDVGIEMHAKDVRNVNILQANIFHRPNTQLMMSFVDDDNISIHSNNLTNVGRIDTGVIRTDSIQRSNGAQFFTFSDDSAMNLNGKNIIEINKASITNVETDSLRRKNATVMMDFPDDIGVDCHNKDFRDINIIELNQINRHNSTTMVTFPSDSEINFHAKTLNAVGRINLTGTGGIDGKIRTDLGDIDFFDNLWMKNYNVGEVNEFNGTTANLTNTNTTNLNGDSADAYTRTVKLTITSNVGSTFYHYDCPAGYYLVSGSWSFGGAEIAGSITDTRYTVQYDDPLAPRTAEFRGVIGKAYTSLGSVSKV